MAKEVVVLFVVMGLLIAVLGSALYVAKQPDYDRIDNDLKYRYIKMKGGATPERVAKLEDIFEINRDNAKIRQINKDVKDYERAVKEKSIIDEQTRLRQLEAERLNKRVDSIKNK